ALNQALALALVDVELPERHAGRLDARLDRLDRHNAHVPAKLTHDLLGTLAGLVIAVCAVVRKPEAAPVEVLLLQLGRTPVKRLVIDLDVLNQAQGRDVPLSEANRHLVIPAQVKD